VVLAGEETPGTRGFAVTRLSAAGTLASGDRALQLTGTAWLDRVWGDVPLPGGPLARDRLVLHLSDGTDLSLLRTRRSDGRGIATLDGILVARDGTVRMLDDGAVDLVPVSESGEGLPAGWRPDRRGARPPHHGWGRRLHRNAGPRRLDRSGECYRHEGRADAGRRRHPSVLAGRFLMIGAFARRTVGRFWVSRPPSC
jgi:hypothetical protein